MEVTHRHRDKDSMQPLQPPSLQKAHIEEWGRWPQIRAQQQWQVQLLAIRMSIPIMLLKTNESLASSFLQKIYIL